MASDDGESDVDSVDGDSVVSWEQSDVYNVYEDNAGPSNEVRRSDVSQTYFINHPNHHRFMDIAKRNGRNAISPATRAKNLAEIEVYLVQHFTPTREEIIKEGIFHTDQENGLPNEKTWRQCVMLIAKAIMRHESWDRNSDETIQYVLSCSVAMNNIPIDNDKDWHTDSKKRDATYDLITGETDPLMKEFIGDFVSEMHNSVSVIVFGKAPHGAISIVKADSRRQSTSAFMRTG